MPRSKSDQLAPSARLFSIRSKLPRLPPRLSMKCTSVASRVHGTTGLPCSSLPWWLRMMWSTAWAVAAGKPSMRVHLAAHAVVAERDLAQQLAGVGELDGLAGPGVGLDLADVVQQRAGDGHVAVDAGEGGGQRAHALGHRQAVLEQPVAVGLVVVLRGRGLVPALADLGARGRAAGRAARAGAAAGRCRSAPRGRRPSARTGSAGASVRSARSYSPSAAGAQRADRDARAVALVDAEAAGHAHDRARPADRLGVPRRRPTSPPRPSPLRSPSWSFRNGSPLRFWRSVRPRTTNTSSTSWPSTKSRTIAAIGCQRGLLHRVAKVEPVSDGIACIAVESPPPRRT